MLGRDDSLNRQRDVYAGIFDGWRDIDQAPLNQLAAKFAMYAGEPADLVEQQLAGTASAETVASSANIHHRRLAISAHLLYVLSSALFCAAILTFAGSFLAR